MGQQNEICENGYSVVPMRMVAVTVLYDRKSYLTKAYV